MRAVRALLWFPWGMSMSAAPVIKYLRQLEAQGDTHVNIDDDARLILREFYIRARGATAKGVTKPQVKVSKAAPVKNEIDVLTEVSSESAVPVEEEKIKGLEVTGNTAADKILSLKRQAASWEPARSLDSLRQTMVFSVGNPEADIMLVGEAPGYDEERLGEPFVGKAGQKLDGILKAMGVGRKDVYISNIVKFRPAMPNQTTNNRKPTRVEMDACMPFIREEVKIVAPKVIIALGGTAAQALLNSEDTVGRMRGRFHEYAGIPLRVTYHPSYILHNEGTAEKRKLWEDMLCVMDLLKITVSEKQRGFFLPK